MRIDILTIFPAMFRGPFAESIVKRAVEKGLVEIHIHDIRQWASDRHRTVDDYPYGGGPGMVMKTEPLFAAAEAVLEQAPERGPIVLLAPQGRLFRQEVAREFGRARRLGRGVLRAGPAGIPPVHPAGGLPRLGGAGRAPFGEPSGDRPLAPPREPVAHRATAPRPAGPSRADGRRAGLAIFLASSGVHYWTGGAMDVE